MRFCKICGTAAGKNDKLCLVCGAKIDEEPKKAADTHVEAETTASAENLSANSGLENQTAAVTKIAEAKKISHTEHKYNISADNEAETRIEVGEKNPNLHSEYEDISSYSSESEKTDVREKKKKPVIAPKKPAKEPTTKVVRSVDDVESKTREVSSYPDDENDEDKPVKRRWLSSGVKTALISVCTAVVIAAGVIITCIAVANSGPTAEELFESGQQKYNSEDFYGAIDDLSACVELDTSDVDAYMLLADAYTAVDKEEEAESALEIGYRETGSTSIKSRLDTLSEKLRVNKVYDSLISEGNSAVKNNDYNLAATKFTSAIESKPNISEPYILAADAYINLENYDQALSVLNSGVDKLEGEELDKLNEKLSEVNETVKAIEEEASRLAEEEKKKAEEEERKAQEELEQLVKQPVSYDVKTDENVVEYEETEIYRGEGRWIELTDSRDLPGIEYINKLIDQTLNSYYEFDADLYGVEDEEELYELVKENNNTVALSHCRITVTYNKDGIFSFVIYKYYTPPAIIGYVETMETHTVDLKTGDEYYLDNILSTSDIYTTIKTQAELIGVSLTDEQINSYNFFLAGEELVFLVKLNDWEYEEIPLTYSNTEMFALTIEEDTDTTYLALQ